jgi:hypothetical protein
MLSHRQNSCALHGLRCTGRGEAQSRARVKFIKFLRVQITLTVSLAYSLCILVSLQLQHTKSFVCYTVFTSHCSIMAGNNGDSTGPTTNCHCSVSVHWTKWLTGKLLLALPSTVILASESHGTHDILLSDRSGSLPESCVLIRHSVKLLLALISKVLLCSRTSQNLWPRFCSLIRWNVSIHKWGQFTSWGVGLLYESYMCCTILSALTDKLLLALSSTVILGFNPCRYPLHSFQECLC